MTPAQLQRQAVHQANAILLLRQREREGVRVGAGPGPRRDVDQRRGFYRDPWRYIRDVLGRTLSPQQEKMIELVEQHPRTLFPSGTTLGKSDGFSAYAIYFIDVVGSMPDPIEGKPERGSKVLLVGPGHSNIANFYTKMTQHAQRAERRGHLMPGQWFSSTGNQKILWAGGPGWDVEAFSPSRNVQQEVAHSISGRHERWQLAILEEAQGLRTDVVASVEGMLSAENNWIVGLFNPTESAGPIFQRTTNGRYKVYFMSAFEHPNVLERRTAIEGAISHRAVDDRVRDLQDCRDRGPYPGTLPDPDFGDFLYALPPPAASDPAPRDDGVVGHRDGEVRVYRPRALFESQVLGRYPLNVEMGLVSPGSWDAAVERWRAGQDPESPADRVGVDAAREGDDDSCFCPSWGETAETLLRAWHEAEKKGGEVGVRLLAELQEGRRIRVGEIRVAPKGRGPEVAQYIARHFPRSTWNVDEGGAAGSSVHDHALDILRIESSAVAFSGAPPDRLPNEPWCENVRAALYVRAAMLLERGLVDPPDDVLLREEMLAHQLVYGARIVEDDGYKRKAQSVRILDKDEIKKHLGRSPDRSDSFVLALWTPILPPQSVMATYSRVPGW